MIIILLPKLKVIVDWYLWLFNLCVKAIDLELQEYIDPDNNKKLKEPQYTNPTDYKKVGQFQTILIDDDGNNIYSAFRSTIQI